MIVIPHTNGVIADKDLKKVPAIFVARHSNSVEWIYFETDEEYKIYMDEHFPPQEIIEENGENN